MELTQRETDKLLIFVAALLAERRKAKGLKLNYPEATAYISAAIMEGAREGMTVADLMSRGASLLTQDDVMEGVCEMISEIQVEATFPDGTKLVTVHNPILRTSPGEDAPGMIKTIKEDVVLNEGRQVRTLVVANTGDRPVQVGSHYHFYEVNQALKFERERAYGCRLNIPAGTAVRFEPGQERTVELVSLDGERRVYGFQGAVMGKLKEAP